ncbi:site-specific integrase [uncultured Bacteroides sp.]|uniref:site-specific integrase n=1 Tax=uncultured Bacteroides sp. TaxID=162156 RepID=UPI002AAA8226|nr:site-specific integrase [uncultured Bacteroides sp.]
MSIIKIVQREKVNKDGTAPLYVVFNLNREKIRIPTKISVPIADFDGKSGFIKGKVKSVKDQNLILTDMSAKVSDILVQYRLRRKSLNKEAFFREYNNPSDFVDFHKFVKEYQKKLSKEIEHGTYKHHVSIMKKLETYCPGLQFHELTSDFLHRYLMYLKRKLGNLDSTAYRNLSTIKIYVLAAIKKGYIEKENNPFADFKIKRPKPAVVYLDEEELQILVKLYNSNTLDSRLHETLRFFLFLCFTSLHISDARTLKIEQVYNKTLNYTRIKNRNSKPEILSIPLSEPAVKIFSEVKKDRNKGVLFYTLPADQNINVMLKEIASISEIRKKISSKTGRHTFATIFLRRTKDITTLQKLLGHSKVEMTLVYAHVLQESKIEGVSVFNSFI